jgi:hypothetical protein
LLPTYHPPCLRRPLCVYAVPSAPLRMPVSVVGSHYTSLGVWRALFPAAVCSMAHSARAAELLRAGVTAGMVTACCLAAVGRTGRSWHGFCWRMGKHIAFMAF